LSISRMCAGGLVDLQAAVSVANLGRPAASRPRLVNERVPRLGLFTHYSFAASFDRDLVELEMISPPSLHLQGLPEWTPRRRQLYDRLAERAAPLAGLYASGVFFLASSTWPGRHHLLGHCVREIVQRLPEFLDPQPRSRAQRDEALRSFVDAWLGAGLPTTSTGFVPFVSELQEEDGAAAVTGVPIAGDAVAVPSNVAEAAAVVSDSRVRRIVPCLLTLAGASSST
jgi:hypothetical protein